MFFFDSDVVHFSCMKDMFFLIVAHRVRDSVLISAAMAAVTVVWPQPGQVAPVTLHFPWWTKHCVYVIQLPLRGTLPILTWPEGWLMHTAWQCPLSTVFELQATVPEAIQELQTLMFWDQEITTQIQHLSISTHFHTPATFISSAECRWKWVYSSKNSHQTVWCYIMHFQLDRFLSINRHHYLSLWGSVSSCAAAVISFCHASQHWYYSIDYDLNVCFLYGEL